MKKMERESLFALSPNTNDNSLLHMRVPDLNESAVLSKSLEAQSVFH